jgi:hypothetical protein
VAEGPDRLFQGIERLVDDLVGADLAGHLGLVGVLGVFRNGCGMADPSSGVAVWLGALIFVPIHAAGNGHIRFLARLSQRLIKPDVVACLRAAGREEDVLAALCA